MSTVLSQEGPIPLSRSDIYRGGAKQNGKAKTKNPGMRKEREMTLREWGKEKFCAAKETDNSIHWALLVRPANKKNRVRNTK